MIDLDKEIAGIDEILVATGSTVDNCSEVFQ